MTSDSILTDVKKEQLVFIHDLAHQIWPTTFHHILSAEQINFMLQRMYSISSLQEQMNKGHHFLLAKEDTQCQGYASYELEDEKQITKLHKLYVLPSAQGKGLGRQILEEVVHRAENNGHTALLLNVNRYNQAVQFYKKIGFEIIGEEDNPIGNGFFMNDYVMRLPLARKGLF